MAISHLRPVQTETAEQAQLPQNIEAEQALLGAILVGLMGNYVAFLMPKLSLASNMLLMMAVLLWRPYGLLPAVKR